MKQFLVALFCSLLVAGNDTARETSPVRSKPLLAVYYVPYEDLRPSATAFAQTDPRWRYVRVGPRNVGSIGCTITVLSSIARDAGYDTNPGETARDFRRRGMIDRSGNLYGLREGSTELSQVYPDLRLVKRESAHHRALTTSVRHGLQDGQYVLVRVSRNGGQHWVRAIGVEGRDVWVMDPAGGRIDLLSNLYGSTRVMREAVFITRVG